MVDTLRVDQYDLSGVHVDIIEEEEEVHSPEEDTEDEEPTTELAREAFLRHRLLTASEEFRLGKNIQLAKVMRDLASKYSWPEVREQLPIDIHERICNFDDYRAFLAQCFARASKSKETLIVHNQRLVRSTARPFSFKTGIPIEDLHQAGNFGLIEATERYDPNRGLRFSTPAVWWVRKEIQDYVAEQARPIYVPKMHLRLMRKMIAYAARIYEFSGVYPTIAAVAAELNLDEAKCQEALSFFPMVVSANQMVGEEEDTELIDLVPDTRSVEEVVEKKWLLQDLEELKGVLSPREWQVLVLRSGSVEGRIFTLEEAGRILGGVTRQRIQQNEVAGLRKARQSSVGIRLRAYLES